MAILSAYMLPHPPLIIPEIGKGQEQAISRTIAAYHEAARRIGTERPDTIILLSPHQVMYSDYFHISPGKGAKGDFSQFRAGNVKMEQWFRCISLTNIGKITVWYGSAYPAFP